MSSSLEAVVNQEAAIKRERSIAHRLAQAHFPNVKTIDAFDFEFPTSIPRGKVLAALSLDFVTRKEGFIFMGPPGTGKTHLSLAIGHAACLRSVRTYYTTAVGMINVLSASLADHTLHKALRTYTTPRLLIIDEVGYLPFDRRGSDLFFQVISARYECGSIVLSTNRPFKDSNKSSTTPPPLPPSSTGSPIIRSRSKSREALIESKIKSQNKIRRPSSK